MLRIDVVQEAQPIQTEWKKVAVILASYLFITVALSRGFWYERSEQQNRDNQSTLGQFEAQLQSQLERFSYIPRLLSKDRELIDALNAPFNSAQLEVTNRYLNNVNRTIGAADTYLLDKNGTTIASSNWSSPTSFIGRNFAFRPYFQQAIVGGIGQYFALGSTSSKRGYYYAYPIEYAAESIGVVVVKMDLSHIEEDWITKGITYLVTDSDNIVFMSSRNQWLFHSLNTLSPLDLARIKDERRYLEREIPSLGFLALPTKPVGIIHRKLSAISSDSYLYANHALPIHQLRVWVISEYTTLLWSLLKFLALLHLVYALFGVAWGFARYRRRKLSQLEMIEAQSRQKLEFEVMARTAKLQVEIGERTRAETQLRQTQKELVQSAKLALLGRLSASISHELNNPLAAMRSFAENGSKFLERGDNERAQQNLHKIVALTERMAKISQQLKNFSKKRDDNETQWISPLHVLDLAIELTQPQANRLGVQLDNRAHLAREIQVRVNPVQLEQVLVNLLANAVEAASASPARSVTIKTQSSDTTLCILICDSGSGVPQEMLEQLFTPFATSKPQGLGLGLSISRELIEGMNGRLALSPRKDAKDGAEFVVELPFERHGDSSTFTHGVYV